MEENHVKYTRFKKETIDFILKHHMDLTAKEIAKEVNITPKQVNQILRQHGFKPLDGHTILRLIDLDKFKEMYPTCSTEEIVQEIPYLKNKSLQSLAAKLGVRKINASNTTHYTDEELIVIYINAYNKIGRILTDDEHVSLSIPSAQTYRKHFGNRENLCKKCGIPYNRFSTNIFGKHIGDNENDSFAEKQVKLAIESLNLNYVYGVLYSDYFGIKEFGNRKVDFILTDGDIVIEYFGMLKNKHYEEKMHTKIELCKKYNIKLVPIYPKEVHYKTIENIKQTLLNKINQVS